MRKYLFISILFIGCSQTDNQNSTKTYYDLAGLINQQISELNKNQPLTLKSLVIGEKKEILNTKKVNWQKELELFLQADLNKQSYQLSYEKSETPNMLVYQLKKGEHLPVKTLKIVFGEEKSLKHIEALMHVENYLYQSEKNLSLDFNKQSIQSYRIKGWQELFIGSRKSFAVVGIIAQVK